jgi:hypothetical protein
MEYKLTQHTQMSKTCGDGKNRNFRLYFLNGIQILKQKVPFQSDWEQGFDRRTSTYNVYLLNNNLHQTREYNRGPRNVKYPVSKKILEQFNISKDLKIELSKYEGNS